MGRKGLGSERGWERGCWGEQGGLEVHRSVQGLPMLPAPSPAGGGHGPHGGTGGACLQGGRASLPAAATPKCWQGGAYTPAVAAARSTSPMLQVPAVNPSLLLGHCQVHRMCIILAPSSSILSSHKPSWSPLSLSIVPAPACPTFSPLFFYFFVSAFSLFAYNSCLSYFLPVSSDTISLPPAPSLSFISRLFSILLPPVPQIQLSTPARDASFSFMLSRH